MDLPAETVFLPFEDGPWRMQMGLLASDEAHLICIDERYHDQMAARRALLAGRRDEVFGAVPGSTKACREVLHMLAGLLPRHFPAWFARAGDVLHNRLTGEAWDLSAPHLDPLEVAGRLVQEDLCVIAGGPDGPVLAAAVLCFPTRWRLAEKLGRPLSVVHGPVPNYAERLARPVDRLMGQLAPGRVVERMNWSLVDDPALFQPGGKWRTDKAERITAANAGAMLYLRTERQTLWPLSSRGSVLFGIRVRVHPLAEACRRPADAARLAAAVRAMPEDMLHYKSVLPFRAALLAWLDARSIAAA